MRKTMMKSLAFVVALAFIVVISTPSLHTTQASSDTEKEYLLIFDDSLKDSTAKNDILNDRDINIVEEFSLLNTVLITATSAQADTLKETAGVKGIVENLDIPTKEKPIRSDTNGANDGKDISLPEEIIPWNVEAVGATQVWDANSDGVVDNKAPSTGKGVRIALWDSGADTNHPDLVTNLSKSYNATTVGNKADVTDDYGHGTFMSGIMAAAQNGEGVVGIAPEAKLSIVKIGQSGEGSSNNPELDYDYGHVTPLAIAKAFEWSIKNDMDVIEMTLGWFDGELLPYFGSAEQLQAFVDIFQNGLNACYDKGIVCVAPALNTFDNYTEHDGLRVPQNLEHLIVASATTEENVLTDYSCYANENASNEQYVCAPGSNIISTAPPALIRDLIGIDGIYYLPQERGGTSSANAETAAVCALIVGAGIRGEGHEKVDNVFKVLTSTTTDLGEPGVDHYYGHGLINAKAAVDMVKSGQY